VCQNGLYFYSDKTFSIERPPLQVDEMESLAIAMDLIRQIKGMPPVVKALEHLLMRAGIDHTIPSIVQLENNALVSGMDKIPVLFRSIQNKKVLTIHYQPFMQEKPVQITFHPYLLKAWRNRWYVFGCASDWIETSGQEKDTQEWLYQYGFHLRSDNIWNLGLDRITAVEEAPEVQYQSTPEFDPHSWFDDIIGVTKPMDGQVQDIQVEADLIASFYLESKPLHASQRLLFRDDQQAVFGLRLIPNYEFMHEIMAYGRFVRVIAPETVIHMLHEFSGT
jgi:hypothetical protein